MSKENVNGEQIVPSRVLVGQEAKEYLAKRKKKALAEFREWKAELCKIVNRQSTFEFNKDGSYTFILPSRLVKLVWGTTIKERVKVYLAKGMSLDTARKSAMDNLRDEVEAAHIEMSGQGVSNTEQEKVVQETQEQEEEKAKENLAKLRAEWIKQKDAK